MEDEGGRGLAWSLQGVSTAGSLTQRLIAVAASHCVSWQARAVAACGWRAAPVPRGAVRPFQAGVGRYTCDFPAVAVGLRR